jgi:hypothetical protein
LYKKYLSKSTDRTLAESQADTSMKLAREETKIMVTGRCFYHKNNLHLKVGTGT